jgi:hypothetical protein
MNPLHWFSKSGRTDLAVKYYEEKLFHGKKFKDMQRDGASLIVINATDIGNGVRFSFVQEYFDLLCSNINEFKEREQERKSFGPSLNAHPQFYCVIMDERVAERVRSPDNLLYANRHF